MAVEYKRKNPTPDTIQPRAAPSGHSILIEIHLVFASESPAFAVNQMTDRRQTNKAGRTNHILRHASRCTFTNMLLHGSGPTLIIK